MKISNLKIGVRLGMGFAIVGAMLLLVASIGITRLASLNAGTKLIVSDRVPKVAWCNTIINELNVVARAVRNIIIIDDPQQLQKQFERIPQASATITASMNNLEKTIHSSQGQEILASLKGVRAEYVDALHRFIKLAKENRKSEAQTLMLNDMRRNQSNYFAALEKIKNYQTQLMDASAQAAASTYSTARMVMLLLAAGALFIAAVIAIYVTRSLTGPINYAVRIAQTVAKGDLTSKIEVTSKDETGELLIALRTMNDSLHKVCTAVRTGTSAIAMATTQIAAGNQDLSSRTEEQASSLEETASSMEELTSTVRQNGDNARQANQMAITASDIAVKGGSVVSEVVQTMGAINESSKKMSDIINVIDGIAFQTNILALNAAVEAARAGEQGRGFAVVATEVRNLAQRSAGAAKEIKELIDDSVERVEVGSKLVDQAGATMEEIVGSIRKVTDIMSEITSATTEQVEGIEQVNQAVADMDAVTQQNAALVEEAAAAAEALHNQAKELVNVVGNFHTGEELPDVSGQHTLAASLAKGKAVARSAKKALSDKVISPAVKAASNTFSQPAKPAIAMASAQGEEWEQF